MTTCKECGQYIYEYESPEDYDKRMKKDIPEDALCHTCSYVCIFHGAKHYKCMEYKRKGK